MIRFENVTIKNLKSVSFEIKGDLIYKIVTQSEQDRKTLLDAFLAFHKPDIGKIFIFDKDLSLLSERELLNISKRLGVVLRFGGLMSNLTVWDNIILPLQYHMEYLPDDIDQKIVNIFNDLWDDVSHLSELLKKHIGGLPVQLRRLICMVRTMLVDPDVIIYDSMFSGFDHTITVRLINLTKKFHNEKDGRVSIFLESENIIGEEIKADIVFKQCKTGFMS